ncbi:MAG: fibrobacter succinogenes major paralogous domain-containing protein [Prevotella sp.]|uniref:fibrobacter succinogenes major paralogous domain-containing protein n=1 Tax=Prevotella sp. TaxID=59823 RepID=UPI002A2731CE|nr:FISUMP domain-containing protein [Prevotella sp.]MDD7317267.1 fibrobacter succinogenes major paralogous domain-containing protein [Prevotellaceae bacterium]MDY4019871.1 fibrobacter succinogenes major paralogous domain-containing protein [Prevotella sp.]
MKRNITTFLLLIAITAAWGQTERRQMILNMKDGTKNTFYTEDIDFVSFTKVEDTPTGGLNIEGTLSIEIPTTFGDSYVLYVMQGSDKIAEICLEYIKTTKKQTVVVYPVDRETRKVDLTKGISATDGGTVVWDEATNKVTYTAGTTPLSTLYISNDGLTAQQPAEVTGAATVKPELLRDIRGTEVNEYRIVKIGTQYWMADNLKTKRFTDGNEIAQFSAEEVNEWNANTTGACHIYADSEENFLPMHGRLYNGYAVLSESGLAPEGWEIPTIDQWQKLKTYAGSSAALYKDNTPMSWIDGGEGTNLTGFSALPSGYFNTGLGDTAEGVEAYFWSKTVVYDPLTKTDALCMARLNNVATGFAIYKDNGHDYKFGHSVRCVRK